MSPAIIELHKKFGESPIKVLGEFNPTMQTKYCRLVDRCYFGTAPTVALVGSAYGKNIAESWLMIQLNDLSEFAGCKDKLQKHQIKELATMMLEYYGHYKLTEFMLFFQKFKKCEYGKFYGAVDPMVIMGALDTFNRDRMAAYYKRENEIERAKKEAEEREYQALRQNYRDRVPDAFTDKAPLSFTEYRALGYEQWNDEAFHNELQDIQNGVIVIPKTYPELIEFAKSRKAVVLKK